MSIIHLNHQQIEVILLGLCEAMLASIVREEVREANLAVTRAKLNHFLWWMGGQQ